MQIPICPVHRTEMRESRAAGQYFCPQKIGTGAKDYCREKATAEVPAAPAPQVLAPAPATGTNGDLGAWALAAACVTFAGVLSNTNELEMEGEAKQRVSAARAMYAAMKELVAK